jgi:phospholipid transport system transporter-binding protein
MQDAGQVLAEGLRALAAGEAGFDLGAVSAADSAAVAILLAWQRAAQARGVNLEVRNPPPALRSLATLYGVDELLPFAREFAQQRH